MKKIHLLLIALVTVVASAITSSCSSTDEPLPEPTPNEEGTTYEVSLNLAGEYTDITEEPLSRAGEEAPKKYYGIEVYCMKTDGTETKYSNYAYGVFDNKESMTISLLGGYKYRFICASFEDGEESLYVSDYGYTGQYPFNGRKVTNAFTISSSNSGFTLSSVKATTAKCVDYFTTERKLSAASSYSYADKPNMKILYGALDDFVPSQGATATIPMYKVGYGLRIVVNGVPDGSLYVSPSPTPYYEYEKTGSNPQSYSKSLSWSKSFTESGSIENVFTGGIFDATKNSDWKDRILNYTTQHTIYFTWTRANGYQQSFNKSVTLKRNVMTVLTVNLTGGASDMNIGIDEYAPEMTTEEDNIDYDGGDMNDTPVNPEE